MEDIRIGFIPLIDCAAIVAAHEMGFGERHGIRLALSREPSWAAIRDKVAFGRLDAAQMLAPMPLAMTLGLGGDLAVPMVAPLALGRGGNAITVSLALHAEMLGADPAALDGPRALTGRALGRVAAARRAAGRPRLRFAFVFPFSAHHYELRQWLERGGLGPEDIELTVIPPARMVENLATGLIDGFCVGEPWNQLAVEEGLGVIVAAKADIAPDAPEKVLGLTRDWATAHPEALAALVESVTEAAFWAETHREELVRLLAGDDYLALDREIVWRALERFPGLAAAPLLEEQQDWLLDRMAGCRQIVPDPVVAAAARSVFRPIIRNPAD